MPKNAPGEVNLNQWFPSRPWSISIARGPMTDSGVATLVAEWATARRSRGACFLAGQVSPCAVARPGGVVDAVLVHGEINPEHATHCSDDSGKRLLLTLARLLMRTNSTTRAWLRYDGQSMAVSQEWVEDYFVRFPSSDDTAK